MGGLQKRPHQCRVGVVGIPHAANGPASSVLVERRELPQRQRGVPVEAGEVGSRPFGIPVGELLAGRVPALQHRDAELLGGRQRAARLRHRGEEVANVEKRIAERRQLPVQYGGDLAGPVDAEDDVADPVVVVDDRRPRLGRHVRGQPGVDLREMRRRLPVIVRHQTADPAAVALIEALRTPEASQSRGPPVHGVQVRERVGKRMADPPPERGRVQGGRRAGRDHGADGKAHDVARHVDDLAGPGGGEQPRDRHRRARECPDETCLAQHVMGARRGRRRRRATDDNPA